MVSTDGAGRVSLAPWVLDAAVAAVVTAASVLGTMHMEAEAATDRPIDGLAVAVGAVAGGVLIGRRRWPWPVFVLALAAATVFTARSYPGGPIYLAAAVALYGVATASPRWLAYLTAAATGAWLFAVSTVARGEVALNDLLFFGWSAVAALAADAMRGRRERAAADAERERHLAEQHEEEQRRLAAEERLRIARDLHDSVAHSIATINVQSGVAAHVLSRDADQAGEALEAIRTASRDVLEELGAMLDLLRGSDEAPRQPTPDLTRIDTLVESSRLAGLDVEVRRYGTFDDVGPSIGTAAYRITQEALTNVIRHAEVDRATVILRRTASGGVELDVVDSGRGTETPSGANGSGVGLVGIRERAALSGGRAEIGPQNGGGFRVRVSWEAPA